MSTVIHKHALSNIHNVISAPMYSKIIHIDYQGDTPYVWMESDKKANANVDIEIVAVLTGGIVPANGLHLKTILNETGSFVLHFYLVQS